MLDCCVPSVYEMWRDEVGITEMLLAYIGEFVEFDGWSSWRNVVIDILSCHEDARRQRITEADVVILNEDINDHYEIQRTIKEFNNSDELLANKKKKKRVLHESDKDMPSCGDAFSLFPPIELEDANEECKPETSTSSHKQTDEIEFMIADDVGKGSNEMKTVSVRGSRYEAVESYQSPLISDMECKDAINENNANRNFQSIVKTEHQLPIQLSPEVKISCEPSPPVEGTSMMITFKPKPIEIPRRSGLVERRPYSCRYCGKMFKTCSAKISHERIHTGEKPFSCSYCEKSFTQVSHKRNHEQVHRREKPYHCSYCDKSFCRNEDKQTHERMHTGEKPFTCSYCSKSLSSRRQKRSHERIHTGIKSYICSFCSKLFRTNSALKRHERTHFGDRPYECKYCSMKFSEMFEKIEHERIHNQVGNV